MMCYISETRQDGSTTMVSVFAESESEARELIRAAFPLKTISTVAVTDPKHIGRDGGHHHGAITHNSEWVRDDSLEHNKRYRG